MRIHPLIRSLLAAVLSTSALVLVACGDNAGAGGESSANREAEMQEAQIKFARCMREHGIDMDDPKPGERGIRLAVPEGVSPEKAQAANEECKKYLDAIKPPELSEEQQKEAREAALAHSRCMREHGIDFPDPKFGEDGGATIQIGPESGIDPNSSKFRRAQKECESELPRGGQFESSGSEKTP